jgi:hypothetical protein
VHENIVPVHPGHAEEGGRQVDVGHEAVLQGRAGLDPRPAREERHLHVALVPARGQKLASERASERGTNRTSSSLERGSERGAFFFGASLVPAETSFSALASLALLLHSLRSLFFCARFARSSSALASLARSLLRLAFVDGDAELAQVVAVV